MSGMPAKSAGVALLVILGTIAALVIIVPPLLAMMRVKRAGSSPQPPTRDTPNPTVGVTSGSSGGYGTGTPPHPGMVWYAGDLFGNQPGWRWPDAPMLQSAPVGFRGPATQGGYPVAY